MIAQKDVSEQVFTAYLGSWRDTDESDKGEVTTSLSFAHTCVYVLIAFTPRASTPSDTSTKTQ